MTSPSPRPPVRRRAVTAVLAAAALLAGGAPAASASTTHEPRRTASMLTMNLCLSGVAGCFGRTQYPAVVAEAVARVEEHAPDAVTLTEACSGDAADVAAATGYDLAFSVVAYGGGPLPCRSPEGRGVFGLAVLTREDQVRVEEAPYAAQLGAEERRWACATTTDDLTACVTHLSTAGTPAARATNDAQCAELADVVAAQGTRRAVLVAGDVNRLEPCAPAGAWSRTDAAAAQAPGIQHVCGTRAALAAGPAVVLPLTYTDHDGLLVGTRRRG